MDQMEIISASGKIKSQSTDGSSITVDQPGATVKVTLHGSEVTGAKKIDNNLVLIKNDGKELIIEDFFQTESEKTRLIFENDGKLFQANYDPENFTGLHFTSVTSQEETAEENDDAPLAEWVVPVIAGVLAATGVGILIAKNRGGDDDDSNSGSNNDAAAKKELDASQTETQAAKSKLEQSSREADQSLQTMKAQPDADTLKAATDADTALKASIAAAQKNLEQFAKAIESAKAAGISTTEAEAAYKQMADALKDAKTQAENAKAVTDAVEALIGSPTSEAAEKLIKAAQDAANLAKTHPGAANIAAATAQLTETKVALQTLQDERQKAIEAAEALGINTAAYKAADASYQDALLKIEAALQEALENQQRLETANEAVSKAVNAQQSALTLKQDAATKLDAALKLKALALENNQLDQIESVNLAIREANEALKAAQQAVENANELARLANEAITAIGAEVVDKPQPVDAINLDELAEITKELSLEEPMTVWESILDFGNSVIALVTNITDQIANSTLVELIGNIGESIGQIPGAIWNMVTSIGDVIGFVYDGVGDSVGQLGTTIGDVFDAIVGSIGDAIGSAFDNITSGIMKAINDVLSQINLGDIFNPVSWFGIAKDLIIGVISESVGAIWKTIEGIPGQIFEAIAKTVGAIGEGLAGEWDIIQTAFSDSLNVLFEAFIKKPVDLVLNALLVDSEEFWQDPLSVVGKIAETVGSIFSETVKIITDLFELPGKFFDKIGEVISNIMNSSNPGKVVEVSEEDMNALMKALQDEMSLQDITSANSADEKLIKTLLDSVSTKNGDIDLDNIAPEATGKVAQYSESVETDNVINLFQQPVIQHDEMTDIAMTA